VKNDHDQVILLPFEENFAKGVTNNFSIDLTHWAGSLKSFWTKTEPIIAFSRPLKIDSFFLQKSKKLKKLSFHINAYRTVKSNF